MFGANYWIAKNLMPDPLLPRQIIFFRVSLSAVLFWLLSKTIKEEHVGSKHLFRIAISSVLGVSVNQILFFEGLNLTNPIDAAILQATSPIMVLLFATLIIRERISLLNVAGILLGTCGAVLLTIAGAESFVFEGSLFGNILILCSITCYAMYLVLIKPMMIRYHPLTVMKWVFLFGFMAAFPFTVGTMFELSPKILDFKILLSLAYVVLITTMLAYLLTIFGLKHLKASSVGYYIYLQPLMAGLVGFFWFNRIITLYNMASAILIFAGVYLVNQKKTFVRRKKIR